MRLSLVGLAKIFRRSQSGNVAIIAGLSMTMLVGFCGLGVDMAYWFYGARQLHAAADIASYDATVALNEGGSGSTLTTAATTGATANGWTSANGTITVNNPPKSGTHETNKAVEVILTENMPRYFTALFSSSTVTIQARSVSTTQGEHDACVIALGSTGTDITMSGGASLSSPNCDVVSDSSSSSSISMVGGASVTTPCLVSVGGVSMKGGSSYTLNSCTSPTTNAPVATDPYASVPQPTHSGSCITYTNQTSLSPGYYCNGLSLGGGASVTFQPGTYYISGGGFSVSSGATATGTGVTIFVAAGNNVTLEGGASVTFSAPTSGTYSGITFFGDRSGGGTNTFTGGSTTNITGAIYFPTQSMDYTGGTSDSSVCTQLIADTVTFHGGANFDGECAGDGVSTIQTQDGGQGSIQIAE
jgi:Flp pilus assembly protein TadG